MSRKEESQTLSALMEAGTQPYNSFLQSYIQDGGKTVGFLYQETPEEIITAAGATPVYIRGTGSEGTEFADAFFRQLTCNYTRHTYNQILNGEWDFLDGAVFYNICDHARRIYDNWKTVPDNPVYHFIYIPKKRDELAKDFYRKEIDKFIKATEERFDVKITPEKLREAIKLHNKTRTLQRELYEMQKGEKVYLTGAELIMVMLAGVSMPRQKYNELLEKLIQELKAEGPQLDPKVRLLYTGGHADSKEFFDLLESEGAGIVVDDLGFGSRACWKTISEEGDPLEAIIDYYFEIKPAATRQMGTQDDRLKRVCNLVKDFSADGVIATRLYMCDIWAFEQYMLRNRLGKEGIPNLELEVDYTPEGEGQIKTRVQAFIESIEAQKN